MTDASPKTPQETLKIFALGGLSILRNDAPVTGFISRKVEGLLVYVACNSQEHQRESLAELLWPDQTQARAMANLRMAISNLQHELAPFLIITRQSVQIEPQAAVWVDARTLESELDGVNQQREKAGRVTLAAAERLKEAVALYKGDFLTGFHVKDTKEFEDWALIEQERLRNRVIEGLDRMICDAEDQGLFTVGIAHARRLIQLDPLHEEANRHLMLMLARTGQRNAALAQYEAYSKLLDEELGVEPTDETMDLFDGIQSGEVKAAPPPAPVHNLPSPAMPFVGRQAELERIAERLDQADCRLLTLVGPGGIGKTRLALHLALQTADKHADGFQHGVCFVALAPVSSLDFLPSAIAGAMDISFQGRGSPKNQLIDYLAKREMLLVLDSFEHLLDGAELLSDLLHSAPALKIVVTSREVLHLHEECILPVEGLDSPPLTDAKNAAAYSAVQLFVQSAQRVQAGFTLAGNEQAVTRVCQLVEGLPLGIELAAAWTRMLPCDQIAAQIEHDLDFLATTVRNVPERHRSIKLLFEHAWRNLTIPEQNALMELAIFRGGFEREGAMQVGGASLPILASLVEKSLIRSHGADRYDIHKLLRRFSLDKLSESGQTEAIGAAHCAYFMQRAEELNDLNGIEQFIGKRLDTDYDNLREALSWALERKQGETLLRIGSALVFYWKARGYVEEGRRWLADGLSLAADVAPELRARALCSAGILAWSQSDFEPARMLLQLSLKQYRQLGDKAGMVKALNFLGYVILNTGNYGRAQALYEEMLTLAREQGNASTITTALDNLGLVALVLGDYDGATALLTESLAISRTLSFASNESFKAGVVLAHLGMVAQQQADYPQAQRYYEESLAVAREVNHKPNTASVLANLGDVAHKLDDYARARELYMESLLLFQELGDRLNATGILERFARLSIDDQQPRRAVVLLGAAESLREGLGAPIVPHERARHEADVATAKSQLDTAAFDSGWAQGKGMQLEQAITFSLQ